MASIEWRKVNLLDLKPDDHGANIINALNNADVLCYTSGRDQIIICDSLGMIHVFDKDWQFISFKGHEMSINLCALSIQNNLLVTISGEDVNEVFKVWNLSKITKEYGAPCLRKVSTELLKKSTALAVSDNGQIMAIGDNLGSISLYRGDIGRDNTKMLKNFNCSFSPIIGIAFQMQGKKINMFVCSDSFVVVYNVRSKDKEIKIILDSNENYSPTRCCSLKIYEESANELNFFVGRDNAIHCFNVDGRGPCYVLDGEKSIVDWYKTSLVVVSKLPKAINNKHSLSVIDIQDNIIIFNCNIDEVVAIFKEFGGCYILTKNNDLFSLCDKDLQSKLNVLFKKNQYEVAVKIASRQQYNAEGLAGIYKQYADHLYAKRDYEGAVANYIKTIGYVEPSYVTRKFLDSKHITYLTTYLLALHENKTATSDHHKILLLNCLTRLEMKKELTEFLSRDRHPDIMFDLNVAIEICRKASPELALDLSKRNQKHEYCIKILIENMKSYEEALYYISNLSHTDAEQILIKYGVVLMNKCPKQTTDILKDFCTNYRTSPNILNLNEVSSNAKILKPEKFLNLFYNNSDNLIEFLEYNIRKTTERNPEILNTLIELYLRKWQIDINVKDRLMEIFQLYERVYDMNLILILCRLYNFEQGIIWIYEQNKLYHLVVRYHIINKNYNELMKFCERNGPSEPSLWLQVLNGLKSDNKAPPEFLLSVLNHLHTVTEKSPSPLQILNFLVAEDNNIKLSNVRDFLLNVLKKESRMNSDEEIKVTDLRENIKLMKENIENFRENPVEFRNTTCDACNQRLTMPAIYFLCKHAFHQECLRIYSDSEKDCNICHEGYSQLKNKISHQMESRNEHDPFHKTLTNSQEPFSIVSQYFGYGLFNTVRVIREDDIQSEQPLQYVPKTFTSMTEGQIRLSEGNKQPVTTDTYIPKSESRMRSEEAYRYERITDKKELVTKKAFKKLDKISSNLSKPESKNPFETDDDDYDRKQKNVQKPQTTNPFEVDALNEEVSRPKRNIRSDTFYDKNKNPFENN